MRLTCQCGREFEARGTWQKLCWECWRDREQAKADAGDLTGLAARASKAVSEAYEAGRRRGYDEGHAAGSKAHSNGAGKLSPGLLRELVMLCHPDRHPPERFDLANRVTAELVSMRKL